MHLPATLPLAATGQHALTLPTNNSPFRSAALPPRRAAPERAGKAGRVLLPASGQRFLASAHRETRALGRDLVEAGRIVAWIAPKILVGVVGAAGLAGSLTFGVGLSTAFCALIHVVLQ
ncbi:hypothetical protein Sa4125_25380 [Aureimonas sp. SA4125]|uniref:hypothetical protein n=1 Tax=Aureimonas sp. SA4125 TaxID=2826993 RepID=UPI001CC7731C|nr:hypothetical protein [Aureimonas sp. SA4125]BDA84996.1 hypothetical protein Sa4125_25380 [Aureimonas sp. SA4125]